MCTAALLLPTLLLDPTVEDGVDVIEVNHVYRRGETGVHLVFDQVIFWEWLPSESRYEVVAWRMLRDEIVRTQHGKWIGGHATPLYHTNTNQWESYWLDGRDKVFRRVTAKHAFHSATFYDVEIEERKIMPQHKRRGLSCQKRMY